jgi:hypothetical protein
MAIRLIDGSEFLHIPKTGGTWVANVLGKLGIIDRHVGHKHATYDFNLFGDRLGNARQLATECVSMAVSRTWERLRGKSGGSERSSRFRFCFVRHPLTWYESWWKYMSARGWSNWGEANSARFWHPNSLLNGLGSDDFNTFVRNVIQARPGYVTSLYYAYAQPGISFIGKMENLTDDTIFVLEHLGLNVDRSLVTGHGRVNESAPSVEKIDWDAGLRETVMRLELPALTHFGYMTPDEAAAYGLREPIEPNKALHRSATLTKERVCD